MAKKIIWTLKAQTERKEILQFWRDKTKSNRYSFKLNDLIKSNVSLIALQPKIGFLADKDGTRVKVIKDYLLFYEERRGDFHSNNLG